MTSDNTTSAHGTCIACGEHTHDCRATRLGQTEYHDLRICSHYVAPQMATIGETSGPLCDDCAFWCDGNATS